MTLLRSTFGKRLLAIVLGGLALRVAYVMVARRDAAVWGDAVSYHVGANLLADGEGFVDPLRFELAGFHTPSAYHPPLYMAYLSVWSFVGFTGPLAHRLATCLLGAAVVFAAGMLGRRLGGDRAGLLAAAFAALYPYLWLNDGALLSESATALAVLLVLIAADRFREQPGLARAAQLGAAGALCALGRAELVLLLVLLVLPVVLLARDRPWRDRVVRLGAAAGAALVVLGPWVGYNLVRFDEPVTLSNGLGATVAAGACDAAFHGPLLGYWAQCEVEQASIPPPEPAVAAKWKADPEGTRAERQAYFRRYLRDEPDESTRDIAARDQAVDYIRDHTGRFPVVVAARVGRIWNVYRPLETARYDQEIEGRGVWARWAPLAYYALLGAAVVGLIVLRRAHRPIFPYLVLAGVVTVGAAVSFGIERYRVPVDVVLPVLAAVGVDGYIRRREPAPEQSA